MAQEAVEGPAAVGACDATTGTLCGRTAGDAGEAEDLARGVLELLSSHDSLMEPFRGRGECHERVLGLVDTVSDVLGAAREQNQMLERGMEAQQEAFGQVLEDKRSELALGVEARAAEGLMKLEASVSVMAQEMSDRVAILEEIVGGIHKRIQESCGKAQ